MSNEHAVNGFTNYETWCVYLWMSNDAVSYEYFRDLAVEARNDSTSARVQHITREEAEQIALAQTLRDEFADNSPLANTRTVYADLLNAALAEVNWYELAATLLSETPEGPCTTY